MQWKLPDVAKPVLPSPTEYGWIRKEEIGSYEPVMTDLSFACKCKTGCTTLRLSATRMVWYVLKCSYV